MENEITVPETLQEAIVYFSNPDNAHGFMVAVRWPDGVECPYCSSRDVRFMTLNQKSKSKKEPGKIIKRHLWQCNTKTCRRQFTAKVGTIFEDSPLGLDKWFPALWLITNCKNGVSSYELARDLKITQKSTWFMTHRLREAMKAGSILKMSGAVESDETYIGGLEKNKHYDKKLRSGRGGIGKAIVQGVIERSTPARKSRVAAKVIDKTDAATLEASVREYVVPGSALYTDAHPGYRALSYEFIHEFVDHTVAYAKGAVHTNGMENFFSLLKRALKGTYVSVEPFHLERFVDEQAFRFNHRDLNDAGRFLLALRQVVGRRLTWKELTDSYEDFYRWMFQYC